MRTSGCLLCLLVAGCGGGVREQPVPLTDLSTRDYAASSRPDLALPLVDLSATEEDLAFEEADAGPADLRTPRDLTGRDLAARDMAMRMVDAGPAPDLAQSDGGPSCHPIVNELMAGSMNNGNDEFIELYNPCANDVVLMGWSLCYRAAMNARPVDAMNDNNNVRFPNNAVIRAGSYFVGCAAPFPGKCDWKYAANGVMANMGGAAGIRNPNGLLMNSVGYGAVLPMNAFVQTAAAPAPPLRPAPGASIGRLPNAVDTFHNARDFKVTGMITPGAMNQ